ncbi:MAG: 4-hydroxy-2-oxovalerate aldolase [Bdellovibrionales bacterium RIFCSPHIGHO2_01_FULL_40_29]|nr:MAG: 4-hydroxy-2-oxovalerate aldolase [Bdellovibrionales bacterium RIFCSPHIGHO2_01_FULL_40_29]OFZ34489.1 MAG: 4-hydroxy-2-oxovalerate aldolase [Bdellovibrionales bacterium RIFCSPHIGHO2_02_FULL_40_15]
MKKVLISDPTLRDGNHAIRHQLKADQIAAYCKAADNAGIPIVEVGHGNGIGASSLQLGESACSDELTLKTARENLKKSKLGIHMIPGFATIDKDMKKAIDLGVDVFRVASHCTEADVTQRHIEYARNQNKTVYGVLMMSHMASKEILAEEAKKMESYGAQGLIIMDSAGNYLPTDVTQRISALVNSLTIPVGFHAHNNLGMAIANSIAALEAGAEMLDGCARGFGAGAGNAQLEVLVAVLHRMGYETGIDFYKMLDCSDLAEKELMPAPPTINSLSIVSGLSGVFSGFMKPVSRIAKELNLDARDIFFELGKRKIVAGQEDFIMEVAKDLQKKNGINA